MREYGFLVMVWMTVLAILASCSGTPGVRIDDAMGAIEGGDVTALIDGCGRQVQDGAMLCRKTEGDAAQDKIYIVAPPIKCADRDDDKDGKPDPCVTFKIFFPDGSPAYGDSIPQGQTRRAVAWSSLLKGSTFELGHRGFWAYSVERRFNGTDGHERREFDQGFIFLVVLRKGYTSLHEIAADPNYAWQWAESGAPVKVTSSGRAYVGGGAQ